MMMVSQTNDEFDVSVSAVRDVTPRIKTIELVAIDKPLPRFTAGAHVDVRMSDELARSYSIASDADDVGRYLIAVLHEAQGRGGSAWMHANVKPGSVLRISRPANNFPLHEAADEHVLIAGGIGITPILSMARRLKKLGKSFTLHYCARSREEAAFLDDVESILGEHARLYLDNGVPEQGLNLGAALRARPAGAHVYLCGPRSLIDAGRAAAGHWPAGTVHFELFSSAALPLETAAAFVVELARSGKIVPVASGQSVLDALAAAGVKVKTVCRDGVCGTCRVRVLSGRVSHHDDILDDEERKEFMQVCVSRAALGEPRLLLDL